MTEEKITLKKVKCVDDNEVETDCVELKCSSCGFSPILKSITDLNRDGFYACPSCELTHWGEYETD
jgi:predicted RNA-binding Zn-ribbon protein involved in translation (DUF1610 family)